jgi:hypothetical protein
LGKRGEKKVAEIAQPDLMEEGMMSYQGEGEPVAGAGGRPEEGSKSNRNTFITLVASFAAIGSYQSWYSEEYCRIKLEYLTMNE